jgi:hypothetical protein
MTPMADRRCDATWLLLLLIPFGCGGPSRHPSPPAAEARRALETALDAWKQGRVKSLNARTPPVRLVDQDQAAGRSLNAYRLTGEPEAVGPTLNFPVELTLRDRRGASRSVSTVYQVALEPDVAVFRNDP